MRCPLCVSKTKVIEEVNHEALKAKYIKLLGKEVLSEFASVKKINLNKCLECDLEFFSPTTTGSEKFYELLQNYKWYYMDDKDEYHFAKNFINDKTSVLEVGSGYGNLTRYINYKNYLGLEFSQEASKMAYEKNKVKVINLSVEEQSRKKKKFDLVCYFQVLEHILEVRDFIQDSINCLKPGGLLLVSVPSESSFIHGLKNNILNFPPHHQTRWSDKTLKKVAEIFSLELLDIHHEPLERVHQTLYFQSALNPAQQGKNMRQKSLDSNLIEKLMTLYSLTIAKLLSLITQNIFRDENLAPRGHAVTVVYRKK